MAKKPAHPDMNQVTALMNRGDFAAAIPSLREAAKRKPPDPQTLYLLGVCQLRMGQSLDAIATLKRAIGVRPIPDAFVQLNLAYRLASRSDNARDVLDEGTARFPDHPALRRACIEQLLSEGEHASAIEELDQADQATQDSADWRSLRASALLGTGRTKEALEEIDSILDDRGITLLTRLAILHKRGDALDKLGEYGRAFEAYAQANRENPVRFDSDALLAKTDRLIEAWTPEALESLRGKPTAGEQAVFILGMPRSGTTLIEQILGRHSLVHAAGELTILNSIVRESQRRAYDKSDVLVGVSALNARAAERIGREYLREQKKIGNGSPRITDKLPSNFRHAGLIACAMPGAPIIHAKRHPLDTALSCFFQNFGSTNTWSTSPETIGVYFKCYKRLMEHWDRVGIEMHGVEYESLVADQERVSRECIGACGLEWEDACLSFHKADRVAMTASMAQVRKPMYATSVARHEKYSEHIAPFIEAMGLG